MDSSSLDPSGSLTYVPDGDFHGSDTFTYAVHDGSTSDTATVTLTVSALNDAPVAAPDGKSIAHGTSVLIDVLANDADADADPLTITSVGTPSAGHRHDRVGPHPLHATDGLWRCRHLRLHHLRRLSDRLIDRDRHRRARADARSHADTHADAVSDAGRDAGPDAGPDLRLAGGGAVLDRFARGRRIPVSHGDTGARGTVPIPVSAGGEPVHRAGIT